MVLFRQINTPRPAKWSSGRRWFLEVYDDSDGLSAVLVLREILSPPVISVERILSGDGIDPSVIEDAIKGRWPTVAVRWTCREPATVL